MNLKTIKRNIRIIAICPLLVSSLFFQSNHMNISYASKKKVTKHQKTTIDSKLLSDKILTYEKDLHGFSINIENKLISPLNSFINNKKIKPDNKTDKHKALEIKNKLSSIKKQLSSLAKDTSNYRNEFKYIIKSLPKNTPIQWSIDPKNNLIYNTTFHSETTDCEENALLVWAKKYQQIIAKTYQLIDEIKKIEIPPKYINHNNNKIKFVVNNKNIKLADEENLKLLYLYLMKNTIEVLVYIQPKNEVTPKCKLDTPIQPLQTTCNQYSVSLYKSNTINKNYSYNSTLNTNTTPGKLEYRNPNNDQHTQVNSGQTQEDKKTNNNLVTAMLLSSMNSRTENPQTPTSNPSPENNKKPQSSPPPKPSQPAPPPKQSERSGDNDIGTFNPKRGDASPSRK